MTDYSGENLTETEKMLIDKILTNLRELPAYQPGTYRVQTLDGKWKREYYALSRARAIAIAYLDRGDDGKEPLTGELIRADPDVADPENLIEAIPDRVLPGSGL